MADNENAAATGGAAQGARQVKIERIYLKDCSFESPATPQVFSERQQPEFHLDLGNQAREAGEGVWEGVLTLRLEAKSNDRVVYLAEVHQGGLFRLEGFGREELDAVLGAYCPEQLFPFAREAATSLVARGAFPAPQINPVNFQELYAHHRQQAAGQAGAGGQG
jgi:preprotein translocase subunit SecB